MALYTREEAARLIDESEGQVIDSSKPGERGHAFAHVGSANTPALDLFSRREFTTMYRNRMQAEKDLRDLLNRHIPELDALPRGAAVTFSDPLGEPRQAHLVTPVGESHSYAGESVRAIIRRQLFVKIIKQQNGTLHLRTMYLQS
jgi:hypothetical protein